MCWIHQGTMIHPQYNEILMLMPSFCSNFGISFPSKNDKHIIIDVGSFPSSALYKKVSISQTCIVKSQDLDV